MVSETCIGSNFNDLRKITACLLTVVFHGLRASRRGVGKILTVESTSHTMDFSLYGKRWLVMTEKLRGFCRTLRE